MMYFVILYFSPVLHIKHENNRLWINFNGKMVIVRKCFKCLTACMIVLAFFWTDEYFNLDSWRVLKKNATGLQFWLKIVCKAISDAKAASISDLNSWDSSVATATDFSFSHLSNWNLMFCAICYYLYNFKNVSVTFSKSNAPPWVFFTFLKLDKRYQISICHYHLSSLWRITGL